MSRNTIETVMGAVVLLVAGVFLWLAYSVSNVQSSSGTRITAEFNSIGGLGIGDEVRISGIAVGKIITTDLDPQKFSANITMAIDNRLKLPTDTIAQIVPTSLLGGNHVELIPGFDEEILVGGDSIFDTRDPVNLADLIGKAVFSSGGDSGN